MFAFSKKANDSSNCYNYIPILLFILVFGLRYSVGIDWENYRNIYEEELRGMSLRELLETRYEIGFIAIVYFCQQLQMPVYMLFVCFSAIQIFFLYKAFKDDKDVLPYVYLTFIFTGIAVQSFCNVIRQDIAFCIFLWAIKYVKEHRLIPYVLLCGLAICFHKSAIILLPIYFVWIRRDAIFNRPLIQILIFACFIMASFLHPVQTLLEYVNNLIILVGYEDYTEHVMDLKTSSVFGPIRIALILAHIAIIFVSKRLKDYYNNPLFNRVYDLYFIGICCYFLFLGNMMFGRITLYFTNFTFIMFAYALYFFVKSPKTYANVIGLMFVSLSLFVSYASLIHHCTKSTDAYVSYFQKELHSIKDMQRATMFSKYK
jgi:hypothetical protein